MNLHHPRRTSSGSGTPGFGFSLIELLVVLAILGIVTALVIPAASHVQRSLQVTSAGSSVEGTFRLARQIATARNRTVEVRIYQIPNDQGVVAPRAVQLFLREENSPDLKPLGRPLILPTGMIFVDNAVYSSLLGPSVTLTGSGPFAGKGSGNFSYSGFRFRGGGRTDLAENGPGGTGSETWFVTVAPEISVGSGKPLPPPNFYTVQIDPVSGVTSSFRP